MLDFLKMLGLENHPALVKDLNDLGHSLAAEAASRLPADINERMHGEIDKVVGKMVDHLPLPAEEAGVVKFFFGTQMKLGADHVLSDFEQEADPPAKVSETAPTGLRASGTPVGGPVAADQTEKAPTDAETIQAETIQAETIDDGPVGKSENAPTGISGEQQSA